ncbi:gephyrin-like molybdotransferase Glp [Litorimonas sp. RW-G-Af-16]|uniref:molybdopterin molybdotransferase MoeA n=1 Tax=Litorimonas sp. RW-G-Af-16 TaxID=3241168 RepID=UPI00390CC19D
MISLSDALKTIVEHRAMPRVMDVALVDALGKTCAADVNAKLTQPPFSASAMDGYAVRFSDMSLGCDLTVIGEAPAGAPFNGIIKAGQAVRLFTGSVIPEGANHVIIQEDVSRQGDTIKVTDEQPVARNIRRAGIDFVEGDVLIRRGEILSPGKVALAAAANHATLSIYTPMTIALLANGDELRPPGSSLKQGQIISSNQAGLGALFKSWGCRVIDLGIAADDPTDIRDRIEAANAADIIVPIGGASVGDHDHMRSSFHAAGFTPHFEKVAVRPGKPTWFAQRGEQRVLGLPGNPASAYVCAHIFLRPLLGLTDAHVTMDLPTSEPIRANGPRDHFQRARVFVDDKGQVNAQPFSRTDSSLITPLAEANALIHLQANSGPWNIGDTVNVTMLGTGPDIFEPTSQ